MSEIPLLDESELAIIRNRSRTHLWVAQDVEFLFSHIAALESRLKDRIEIYVPGDDMPIVVSRLDCLPVYAGVVIREYALRIREHKAEIERLTTLYRAAIESANRQALQLANGVFVDMDAEESMQIGCEWHQEWMDELKTLEETSRG